jgi:Flp pilus assembly protein TadB
MGTVLAFLTEHPAFSITMVVVNTIIVWPVVIQLRMALNAYALEAAGKRRFTAGASIYRKGREAVLRHLDGIAKTSLIEGIMERAGRKLRKAGYHAPGALAWFLFFTYLLPLLAFVITLKLNYPNIARPLAAAMLIAVSVETVLRRRRKKLEKQFNRNAYKVYKFLHNQVSSGISATEAIKTAYEVVNETELRQALVLMAARYELTRDIENALGELVSRFDLNDTHTLCTAIRLGVMTGDNTDMLARQEEIMFKKYFNFIQAETEGRRLRSVVSAIFFTAIIIILISVPLLMDVMESMNIIFSS